MKTLLMLSVVILTVITTSVISILVMIYGWGLRAENWYWIIGGYCFLFFNAFSGQLIRAFFSDED